MTKLFLFAVVWLGLSAGISTACEGRTPCKLGDRSYHVRVPDLWDGTSPLPVLLHFHGWGRQGSLIVGHGRIAVDAVADYVLLIAPNGLNGSWSFRRNGLRDTEFAIAVLDDVARRYPIDRSRIMVSGYSWGANMAWRFACERGDLVTALMAVSGTLPQDETCQEAPDEVYQVFGLGDGVLPFPMGPGGDQTYPVALWREKLGCGDGTDEGAWNARPFLTFQRTSWECELGRVVLDVHPGGHFIPHDWIPLQVEDVLGRH